MPEQHPDLLSLTQNVIRCDNCKTLIDRLIIEVVSAIDYGNAPDALRVRPDDSEDIVDLIECGLLIVETPRIREITNTWRRWCGSNLLPFSDLCWRESDTASEAEWVELLTALPDLRDAPRVEAILAAREEWLMRCCEVEDDAGLPHWEALREEVAAEQHRTQAKLALIQLGNR